MKWKKGSPGKAGMYICKLRVCDEGLMYYPVSYQQFLNNKWINPSVFHQPGDIIEWLDESKGELISAEEILHKWVPKDIWKCGSRSEIVVTYAEAISAMEEYGKQIIDTKVVGETTGENEAERKFTLEEMIECYNDGWQTSHKNYIKDKGFTHPLNDREKYFKEKFNIETPAEH